MGKFNLNDFLKIQDKSIEEQKAQREENRTKRPAYKIAALHISDLVPSEGNKGTQEGYRVSGRRKTEFNRYFH